jgi:hypothetical protein
VKYVEPATCHVPLLCGIVKPGLAGKRFIRRTEHIVGFNCPVPDGFSVPPETCATTARTSVGVLADGFWIVGGTDADVEAGLPVPLTVVLNVPIAVGEF